eukprot:gene3112-1410_t
MYTRKGFDYVRAVLKDGLQLLIYSAKEVLKFFGMNSLWEKQTNNVRRALRKDDPSYDEQKTATEISERNNFTVPDESALFVTEIKSSTNWACWHVLFDKVMDNRNFCKPLSIFWKQHLTMHSDRSTDTDDEFDFEFEDGSEGSSDVCSTLDDFERDMEIVFDEDCDIVDGLEEENGCFSFHLQNTGCSQYIRELNSGYNEMQDILLDKILPCVTKECISLKANDVFNSPSQRITGGEKQIVTKETFKDRNLFKEHIRLNVVEICNIQDSIKVKPPRKTVSFAAESELVKVHHMIQWNFAYRKARKGHWERYACDRSHFKRRIASCEKVLNQVLENKYKQYQESRL